jgi:hypothetical protein
VATCVFAFFFENALSEIQPGLLATTRGKVRALAMSGEGSTSKCRS